MAGTRLSGTIEVPSSGVQTRSASTKRAPSSKATVGAKRRKGKSRADNNPQEIGDDAASSTDEADDTRASQDAPLFPIEGAAVPTPIEGAHVDGNVGVAPANGDVVIPHAQPTQNGSGASAPQRLVVKVGGFRGGKSSASTPGTSATTSGAGTGVNTPASEVSVGTKRKHNEIDDSDPDIIEKYQRMILELMGVMVSSNFHSKYPY